ncbi:autotransporter outer membrane beta-barrel domain-containing protein [Enterobacter hormaechei]|nr:autotransporter outer membrane beta-barrel domain-containing protein [Enterobacter hormaechei]
MNKVYNTVWCASRGMWVVTSELVRKGGQRPRQIRRTVLAGLIAGLLAPQSPALAASYDNQTLQNSSVTLNNGDTATNTTLNSGGILHVSSGGSATSSVIFNYGQELVYDGGVATGTIINGGAAQNTPAGQIVYSGGSAANTIVNAGGNQIVSGGTVTSATVNNGGIQFVDGGIVSGVVIRGGQEIMSMDFTFGDEGEVKGAIVETGGAQNIRYGTATDTILNGGHQLVDAGGAKATGTTVNSGGLQMVQLTGYAQGTVINSSGKQTITVLGKASKTTINEGGKQTVGYEGSASGTVINSGGQQFLNKNDINDDPTDYWLPPDKKGGSASNTVINNGGIQHVQSAGSATNTAINSGGQQFVSSGGSASNTAINFWGIQHVSSGGSATDTIINFLGKQEVSSGGSATDTTINADGTQYVLSGGNATGTVINGIDNRHGLQRVSSGGSAIDTIINSGGEQHLSGGNATGIIVNDGGLQQTILGSAADTVINAGGQQTIAGGSASGTTINGGTQYVVENQLPGNNQEQGRATDTTINAGGTQHVYGASVDATVINEGGVQELKARGSATSTTVSSGGTQYVHGGHAFSTTLDGGVQHVMVYPHPLTSALTSGTAADTIINAGGIQNISSGGRAADTTINAGGLQSVSSGGSATLTTINDAGMQHVLRDGEAGDITLNSGGTLKVDAGGTATTITQNDGGAVVTNTSAVLEGTNRNGSFAVTGGSAGNMLLENGGVLTVYDTHEATDTWVDRGGTLLLNSGGVLKGTTTVTGDGTLAGQDVNNQGHLRYLNNSAAVYNGNITGTGDLSVEGGRLTLGGTLSQDGGVFLRSGGELNMDTLQTRGDVTAQSGTTLNLMNGTTLTGRILDDGTGGGDVTVTGPSVWRLTGDSVVGALTLDAGTVDFHGGPITRLTPMAQAVTLTARTLSGTGTFLMNTDIAAWSGDLLNVTGNASGLFSLGIKNTGQEPVSPGEPLRVVHTGGGDAQFSLYGGKVDAGAWEYYLTRENTDWYLSPDIPPEVPPEVPPEMKPEAPADRQTTASTDAVLSMASAPVYIFNQELQNLRFRRGDVVQNSPAPGGVWGRYLGSDTRISGAAGSGYKLRQSGFETGGDKVFELADSSLAAGAFISFTDNRISHARGGSSDVESAGGGLYATWADSSGLYVDGVVKFSHFSSELRTRMSDGTPVRGDYSQNGYGVSLETGKTFRLNEAVWAEPYVRGTAFRADGKDIRLDNGMKARIDSTKSLQAEAGMSVGMNLDVGGAVVKPYLTAAVSHEFADNNKVRINDRYDFRNDLSGTTGKYGLGVSAQLTPNAGVWAEARYENGRHTESPVTASVGFRINF